MTETWFKKERVQTSKLVIDDLLSKSLVNEVYNAILKEVEEITECPDLRADSSLYVEGLQ